MTDAWLGLRPDRSLLASGRRGLEPRAALRMKGEHVTHGAVHRRRHADLGPEVDHAAGEPLQLEWLALLQVVVHRRRHFGRPAVEERHALFGAIRGQRDPMRAADGDHLAREVEQEFSRERVLADRPDGLAHGGGRAGHGHQRHVFLPDRATDIVADLGVDAAALAGLVERRDAGGPAPVVFPEHQPLQRTRLHDHARPADIGPDISDAAHERVVAEDRPQHIVILHAVLKRDDAGAGLHDRQQLARGTLGVPELDAEHHHIDGADGPGVVGHTDIWQVQRLRPAFNRETALAHGGKMRPACNEMNIGAALDEPGAEIPAHAPRAHDRNSQGALQPQTDAAILCRRSPLNRLGPLCRRTRQFWALVGFASVLAALRGSPHIGLDRPGGCNLPVGRSGAPRGPLKVAYEGFETMSRVPSLSSPFLLGFDEIERALDRVAKAADGYPPYNIERIARQNGQPERLRITLAVAGFTRDQLDVTVEESQLVIRGRQQDDKEHHYLHRGIAARQFQRTFVLADGMEVLGADLKNGLLSIDLARPEPERIVKTISIADRD